jgi:hypothetical protein
MLFQLPRENAGLEALHYHGEAQQLKIGLPLALSKLSKQSILQLNERLIRVIANVECVQNVPEDLLGQAG